MYDIKEYLKSVDVTKSELAKKLKLSRQTLDNYISSFEKGNTIAKVKYQVVFDRLFSNSQMNKEDFQNKLSAVAMLLDRDEKNGTLDLSAEDTDLITSITKNIATDMKSDNCNRDVYRFINQIINGYHDEVVWQLLAKYCLVLNGLKQVDSIAENEKSFISNIFNVLYKYKKGQLKYDEASYNNFLERRNQIIKGRKALEQGASQSITKKIGKIVMDAAEQGIELTEEEILEMLQKE